MSVTTTVRLEDLATVIEAMDHEDVVRRIWERDGTVWTDPVAPEVENRLGWLDAPDVSRPLVATIDDLAAQAIEAGVSDVVLCGMGGSSLAPEVFAATLPTASHHPTLTVLDSTHPEAVSAVDAATDASTTWYVISSKSGGTLETLSLFRHFWARTEAVSDAPGAQFIAITDPGSSLEQLGHERRFRAVVLADPDVGGRYSAITAFGLVPAGLIGADVGRLLDAAAEAATACRSEDITRNPGALTGVALGAGAVDGRRIAYFEASAPALALPAWAEQLIAESTGKDDTGILPVAGGPRPDGVRATVVSLGAVPAVDPDIDLRFDDPYDVAGAMFVLEFATAVAGSLIGIHPFDQPDVQLAKELAHAAMRGDLDVDADHGVPVGEAAEAITELLDDDPAYVSVHAYVPAAPAMDTALATLATALTERSGAYVTTGYGPRFLHSTGQLHKGGFGGGAFLQIVQRSTKELPVPETDFTFGELIDGQAKGDRAALEERGRGVITVTIDGDATTAVGQLARDLT
jgi:transaldolase/glucose-6-phosphate isomerase